MSRVLARCTCRRVLVEEAEPFEGAPVVRAASLLLQPGLLRYARDERPEDYLPALLSHFAAGGASRVYCARCRREVQLEHDDLQRVALDRRARTLTLLPASAR